MRIRTLLSRLRRDQEGIAIPTVMIVTSIGFAFVTVGLELDDHGSARRIRDQDSKASQAAADAGASLALLRSNRYLTGSAQCVYPSGSWSGAPLMVGPPEADGWCPAVSGSVGNATWTYRQSPAATTAGAPQGTIIVATGTSGNVTRRIALNVTPESGASIFAEEGLATSDFLTLSGNPSIYVNTGSNGNMSFAGSAGICGVIRHGVGDSISGTNTCPGYPSTEGDRSIVPLSPTFRTTLLTTNRNCQLARTCTPTASYTKSGDYWDPVTRTVTVGENAALTVPAGDYLICRFFGNNGSLVVPAGAKVRIFFDTPEACGLSEGDVQLGTTGNFNIDSTGYNPQTGVGDLPGFYLFGSTQITTRVDLYGGSSSNGSSSTRPTRRRPCAATSSTSARSPPRTSR